MKKSEETNKNIVNNNANKKIENINQSIQDKPTILVEKKVIIYLVIISIVLLYMTIFFTHNIIDRGIVNTTQTSSITYPDNDIKDISDNDKKDNKNIKDKNSEKDNSNVKDNNDNNDKKDNNNNIVEESTSFKIFEGTKEWSEVKELDIFNKNYTHIENGKIAPGVQDTYVYTVECHGKYSMQYEMKFLDENPYNINMKYKLKRNSEYVAGNENTWVNVDELTQSGMKIDPNTIDVFTLEWRWEDSDNDTEIGETEGASYRLNIKSNAKAIIN